MGKIIGFVTGPLAGYVFGGALAVFAIVFAVTVGVYHWKLGAMTTERDGYRERIENPTTGYVARMAQCGTNVATLQTGLSRLTIEVKALADETRNRDKKISEALEKAGAQAAGARRSADKLLALPAPAPVGSAEACRAGAAILKRGVYQ